MKNAKVSWTDLLLQRLELMILQRRVQLQAPKLLIVAMSVQCITSLMCHTQNLKFCKNKVDKCML